MSVIIIFFLKSARNGQIWVKNHTFLTTQKGAKKVLYNIAANVDHEWSDQRVHASASVIGTGRIYRGAKVIGQRAQK